MMKKIVSYNVNGIRAAEKKGLFNWIIESEIDVICLQETKAQQDQVDLAVLHEAGYKDFWFSAEKKGYSGVLILSKVEPDHVEYGCKHEQFDLEGRVIRADFKDYSIYSIYFPSGTTGDIRQTVKYEFLDFISKYLKKEQKKRPNQIICGDYNIANNAIDIHNPKSNKKSSGFLPEERAWLDKFYSTGYIDTFRHFNKDPDWYSWWSYRAGARKNNKGWRIDYISVNKELIAKVKAAYIHMDVVHSDHCPISIEF